MEGEGPTSKYREVIMVKIVTFFIKSLKTKGKKNAGVNFVLLCQLRNIIEQFKKAYLHRPIRILHFLTPATTQKCLT